MTMKKRYTQMFKEVEDDFEFRFEDYICIITEGICEIMEEKGLKRTDLAKKLEVSKPAVTRMLEGSPNFTVKRLLRVAEVLDRKLKIVLEPKNAFEKKISFEPRRGRLLKDIEK